jgi:hypothetical protein
MASNDMHIFCNLYLSFKYKNILTCSINSIVNDFEVQNITPQGKILLSISNYIRDFFFVRIFIVQSYFGYIISSYFPYE